MIFSALGEGTRVTLWLPCAEGRPTETVSSEPLGSALRPSHARILVCDDDGDVRAFVATFLRHNGCTVWEANNPMLGQPWIGNPDAELDGGAFLVPSRVRGETKEHERPEMSSTFSPGLNDSEPAVHLALSSERQAKTRFLER
jgi:hypothetical protein